MMTSGLIWNELSPSSVVGVYPIVGMDLAAVGQFGVKGSKKPVQSERPALCNLR